MMPIIKDSLFLFFILLFYFMKCALPIISKHIPLISLNNIKNNKQLKEPTCSNGGKPPLYSPLNFNLGNIFLVLV